MSPAASREEWGEGTFPYAYSTNEPVSLKIVEQPYTAKPMPLKITWTQETELWISKTILNETQLIDEASWEIKNNLYKQRLDRILYQFEQAEIRRLEKIQRFMKQIGAWN